MTARYHHTTRDEHLAHVFAIRRNLGVDRIMECRAQARKAARRRHFAMLVGRLSRG